MAVDISQTLAMIAGTPGKTVGQGLSKAAQLYSQKEAQAAAVDVATQKNKIELAKFKKTTMQDYSFAMAKAMRDNPTEGKQRDIALADVTKQHMPNLTLAGIPEEARAGLSAGDYDSEEQFTNIAMTNKNYATLLAPQDKGYSAMVEVPGAPEGTLGQVNNKTGEWEVKVKPNSPLVSISNEKEAAKYAYKKLDAAETVRGLAQKKIETLGFIDQQMAGIKTGSLTEVKMAVGKLAESFGATMPDTSNLEAANAGMGDLTMSVLAEFKGAISDGERKFSRELMPKLTQTAEGRAQISSFIRAGSERAIEHHRQMDAYIAENGTLHAKGGKDSFFKQWDEYQKANPLFSKERQKELSVIADSTRTGRDESGKRVYLLSNGKTVYSDGSEYKE